MARRLRDSANGCSQRPDCGQLDNERVRKAGPQGYHPFAVARVWERVRASPRAASTYGAVTMPPDPTA